MNYSQEYTIQSDIMLIVKNKIQFPINYSLHPDEDLFYVGINSISIICIIVELETIYNIVFNDSELLFVNFLTVNNICKLVFSKLKRLSF